jgi:hypothetical protein
MTVDAATDRRLFQRHNVGAMVVGLASPAIPSEKPDLPGELC